MKNLLTTSLLVIFLSTTAVFAQNVSTTPPTSVKNFLNTGASQSRQGWLGIGTMTSPTATLDVRGVSLMNNLKVLGNAVVGNKLSIGGLWNPTVGNGLKIQGGTLRVSTLGGFNKKTLCTEPTGKLSICNTNEVLDKCFNLTGTQSTLPYTYYEQGTGRKIVVTAPTNSTICTRTGESVKQCSDGFSNDTDGAADAADGNCYVPIMTNPVTNKPADPTLAAKFLATIGRPVLKIGSNWYVYDPLKDSESDGSTQVCGNNTIEAPEECDAGSSGSPTCGAPGTANACKMITAVCGNGVIETGEECDFTNVTQWPGGGMVYAGDIYSTPTYNNLSNPAVSNNSWTGTPQACNSPLESNSCTVKNGIWDWAINATSCQAWITKPSTTTVNVPMKTEVIVNNGGLLNGTGTWNVSAASDNYTCTAVIPPGAVTGTGTSVYNSSGNQAIVGGSCITNSLAYPVVVGTTSVNIINSPFMSDCL